MLEFRGIHTPTNIKRGTESVCVVAKKKRTLKALFLVSPKALVSSYAQKLWRYARSWKFLFKKKICKKLAAFQGVYQRCRCGTAVEDHDLAEYVHISVSGFCSSMNCSDESWPIYNRNWLGNGTAACSASHLDSGNSFSSSFLNEEQVE